MDKVQLGVTSEKDDYTSQYVDAHAYPRCGLTHIADHPVNRIYDLLP
jgi:hypothetical protein